MGTVGIAFGSATSGAGFDVAATVTSILAISSGIESPWKTQLSSLAAQDAAFTSIGTNLSSLSSAVQSLTSFDGVMFAKQGSSSAPSVLALSNAGSSAIAGSHTVVVTSLASTSSTYSDTVHNASDTLSGSINIKIGATAGDAGHTITLDSTDDTLQSLATKINSGSYGVSASVVTSTAGSRLSLVSNTSGSAGQITLTPSLNDDTISSASPVGFTAGQPGADAQLTVDGLQTTSASNTVTGAIPGVTFNLLASSPGTPVQVQITNDNSAIGTAVQSMVTAYNAVTAALKTQEGKDSTGKAEPLFGDSTLARLQSQLASTLLGGAASGSISNISQLGIAVNPDGTLSLDSSALNTSLNAHFADVTGFFQNAGSFGQTLTTALNSLGTASDKSAISLALAQNTSLEANLNGNVTKEEALIATQKTTLTAELNAANQILQSIPQQLNQVNEMYSAITGYNQQK